VLKMAIHRLLNVIIARRDYNMKMYKASYKGYNVEYRAPQAGEAIKLGIALIRQKARQLVVAKDVLVTCVTGIKQYQR